MIVCKICGKKVKSTRGMLNHIRVHKITSFEYRDKFEDFLKEEKNPDLIVCPICGKYNFKNLLSHVSWKHPNQRESFMKDFPNQICYTEEFKEICASGGKRGIKSRLQDMETYRETAKKSWETRCKKHPDLLPKMLEASHKGQSDRLKQMWKIPEYREKKILQVKEQHENGDLTDNVVKKSGKRIPYKNLRLRSSWEVRLAEVLDENKIEYEYETFYVYYQDNTGKTRKYYPDFYIKRMNMILEVKPFYQLDYGEVKAKKKACLDRGYNFYFITEKDLFEDKTIINKIIDDYKSNK